MFLKKMEEIEYLEEYEDLVLPAINSAADFAATAKSSRSVNVDTDGSSSSLDQDIFNCLFDDNSDEDNDEHQQPEKGQEITSQKIVKENEKSTDSLKDLDEQVRTELSLEDHTITFKETDNIRAQTIKTKEAKLESHPLEPAKTKSIAAARPTEKHKRKTRKFVSSNKSIKTELPKQKPTSSVLGRHTLAATKTNTLTPKNSSTANKHKITQQTKLSVNKQRPATIVKPEKIVTKDPPEDPLNLDSISSAESANYSVSDISGETYNSLSDFDEDDYDFTTHVDVLDDDDNSSNSQVIDISNDSSETHFHFDDLRVSTPSPVVSEDREVLVPCDLGPKRSHPKFMANHEIIKCLLTKGQKPKLLQLINEHDVSNHSEDNNHNLENFERPSEAGNNPFKADPNQFREHEMLSRTHVNDKNRSSTSCSLSGSYKEETSIRSGMDPPEIATGSGQGNNANENDQESCIETIKNLVDTALSNQEVGAEMEIGDGDLLDGALNRKNNNRNDSKLTDKMPVTLANAQDNNRRDTDVETKYIKTTEPSPVRARKKRFRNLSGLLNKEDNTAAEGANVNICIEPLDKTDANSNSEDNTETKQSSLFSDKPKIKMNSETKIIPKEEFKTPAKGFDQPNTKISNRDKARVRERDSCRENQRKQIMEAPRGVIMNPFVQRTSKTNHNKTSRDNSRECSVERPKSNSSNLSKGNDKSSKLTRRDLTAPKSNEGKTNDPREIIKTTENVHETMYMNKNGKGPQKTSNAVDEGKIKQQNADVISDTNKREDSKKSNDIDETRNDGETIKQDEDSNTRAKEVNLGDTFATQPPDNKKNETITTSIELESRQSDEKSKSDESRSHEQKDIKRSAITTNVTAEKTDDVRSLSADLPTTGCCSIDEKRSTAQLQQDKEHGKMCALPNPRSKSDKTDGKSKEDLGNNDLKQTKLECEKDTKCFIDSGRQVDNINVQNDMKEKDHHLQASTSDSSIFKKVYRDECNETAKANKPTIKNDPIEKSSKIRSEGASEAETNQVKTVTIANKEAPKPLSKEEQPTGSRHKKGKVVNTSNRKNKCKTGKEDPIVNTNVNVEQQTKIELMITKPSAATKNDTCLNYLNETKNKEKHIKTEHTAKDIVPRVVTSTLDDTKHKDGLNCKIDETSNSKDQTTKDEHYTETSTSYLDRSTENSEDGSSENISQPTKSPKAKHSTSKNANTKAFNEPEKDFVFKPCPENLQKDAIKNPNGLDPQIPADVTSGSSDLKSTSSSKSTQNKVRINNEHKCKVADKPSKAVAQISDDIMSSKESSEMQTQSQTKQEDCNTAKTKEEQQERNTIDMQGVDSNNHKLNARGMKADSISNENEQSELVTPNKKETQQDIDQGVRKEVESSITDVKNKCSQDETMQEINAFEKTAGTRKEALCVNTTADDTAIADQDMGKIARANLNEFQVLPEACSSPKLVDTKELVTSSTNVNIRKFKNTKSEDSDIKLTKPHNEELKVKPVHCLNLPEINIVGKAKNGEQSCQPSPKNIIRKTRSTANTDDDSTSDIGSMDDAKMILSNTLKTSEITVKNYQRYVRKNRNTPIKTKDLGNNTILSKSNTTKPTDVSISKPKNQATRSCHKIHRKTRHALDITAAENGDKTTTSAESGTFDTKPELIQNDNIKPRPTCEVKDDACEPVRKSKTIAHEESVENIHECSNSGNTRINLFNKEKKPDTLNPNDRNVDLSARTDQNTSQLIASATSSESSDATKLKERLRKRGMESPLCENREGDNNAMFKSPLSVVDGRKQETPSISEVKMKRRRRSPAGEKELESTIVKKFKPNIKKVRTRTSDIAAIHTRKSAPDAGSVQATVSTAKTIVDAMSNTKHSNDVHKPAKVSLSEERVLQLSRNPADENQLLSVVPQCTKAGNKLQGMSETYPDNAIVYSEKSASCSILSFAEWLKGNNKIRNQSTTATEVELIDANKMADLQETASKGLPENISSHVTNTHIHSSRRTSPKRGHEAEKVNAPKNSGTSPKRSRKAKIADSGIEKRQTLSNIVSCNTKECNPSVQEKYNYDNAASHINPTVLGEAIVDRKDGVYSSLTTTPPISKAAPRRSKISVSRPINKDKKQNKKTEIDILIESMSKEMKDAGIKDLLNTSSSVKRQRAVPKRSITSDVTYANNEHITKDKCGKDLSLVADTASTSEDIHKRSPTRRSLPKKNVKDTNKTSKNTEAFGPMEMEKALIDEVEIRNMNTSLLQPLKLETAKDQRSSSKMVIKPNAFVPNDDFKTPKPIENTNIIKSLENGPQLYRSKIHANANVSVRRKVPFKSRLLKVKLNRRAVRNYFQNHPQSASSKIVAENTARCTDPDAARHSNAITMLSTEVDGNLIIKAAVNNSVIETPPAEVKQMSEIVDAPILPGIKKDSVEASRKQKSLNTSRTALTPFLSDKSNNALFGTSNNLIRVNSKNSEDIAESVMDPILPVELKNEFLDENPNNMGNLVLPDTPTLIARSHTVTQAAASALSNTIIPTDIRLLTNDPMSTRAYVPSFGVTPTLVDAKGARMYTFLHPAKYSRNHGNVLLDYCCPNLDGPMPAIDPTRIHAQVQTPVIELPSCIVLTTKVVTRAELESKSSSIPAVIRKKAEKLRTNIQHSTETLTEDTIKPLSAQSPQPFQFQVANSSTVLTQRALKTVMEPLRMPSPQFSPTVNALAKYLPSTTTITAKIGSSNSQSSLTLPAANKNKQTPSSVSVVAKLPTVLNEKQINLLRSNLRRIDVIFKSLVQPFEKLNFAERHQIIDNLVASGKFLPKDLERTIVLMEEYLKQINLNSNKAVGTIPGHVTNMPPMRMPPLQPAPSRLTPTFKSDTAQSLEQIHNTSIRKMQSTVKQHNAPINTSTIKQRQVPIYDTERNIIGYQLQVIAPATTTPSYTKTSEGITASLASNIREQQRTLKRPAQDSPRVFYTSQPMQTSTPKANLSPTTSAGENSQTVGKSQCVTTVRSAGTTTGGTETITTTTMATVKRVTRSRAAGSKIIIVSKSNSNEETILPDMGHQTEIKDEKDVDDFIG